jgi:hypothetical protein
MEVALLSVNISGMTSCELGFGIIFGFTGSAIFELHPKRNRIKRNLQ